MECSAQGGWVKAEGDWEGDRSEVLLVGMSFQPPAEVVLVGSVGCGLLGES